MSNYAVYGLTFAVNTDGRTGTPTGVVDDVESMSIGIDGGVEEWTPMNTEGWVKRLMTSKSLSVSFSGKRSYGSEGNDYIAGLAYKNGSACNSILSIIFPNGDTLNIPCVINTTSFGGDSTALDVLEWEAMSDGKPTYTPATVTP